MLDLRGVPPCAPLDLRTRVTLAGAPTEERPYDYEQLKHIGHSVVNFLKPAQL